MDALLESLGKLLGVFKDPTQVLLLLVATAEGFAIYKIMRWIFDRMDRDLEARTKLATAMEGLTDIIKEKIGNGTKIP